jgi:hypothetical protein
VKTQKLLPSKKERERKREGRGRGGEKKGEREGRVYWAHAPT